MGAVLARPNWGLLGLALWPALVSTGLIMAGGNALNDVYDFDVDRINKTDRPLPSGQINLKQAKTYSVFLFSSGILISFLFLPIANGLLALFATFLLYLYSSRYKWQGFSGNVATSLLVGLTFFYGMFVYESIFSFTAIKVLLIFILAVTANIGREIVKGIQDVPADSSSLVPKMVLTVAVRNGEHLASVFAGFFLIVAVLLSPLPFFFGLVGSLYIPLVVATDVLLLYASQSIVMDHSPRNAKVVKEIIRVGMLFALLGFVLGGSYSISGPELAIPVFVVIPATLVVATIWPPNSAAPQQGE